MNWILDRNNQPIPCDDVIEWGKWYQAASMSGRRFVAKTDLGHCEVSTVFLGVDYQFGDGPPLLFETMVFGLAMDQETRRCSTWQEAVEQHEQRSPN